MTVVRTYSCTSPQSDRSGFKASERVKTSKTRFEVVVTWWLISGTWSVIVLWSISESLIGCYFSHLWLHPIRWSCGVCLSPRDRQIPHLWCSFLFWWSWIRWRVSLLFIPSEVLLNEYEQWVRFFQFLCNWIPI